MFRTRLSVTVLEARENPSGPTLIDPIAITAPSTDPAVTVTAPTTTDTAADIGTAIVGGATGAITPASPITDLNGITKTPLLP